MFNIEQTPADNLAGLQAIYFTDQLNIVEPEIDGLAILGDINLLPDTYWCKLEATLTTNSFKETPRSDRNGKLYDQSLKGFKAKDSQALGQSLQVLSDRQLAILYRDQNGVMRFFPHAEFSADFDTETPGGRNGYPFVIKAQNLLRALYYTGNLVLSDKTIPGSTPGSTEPGYIIDGNGITIATVRGGEKYPVPFIKLIDGGSLGAGDEQYNPTIGIIQGEPL